MPFSISPSGVGTALVYPRDSYGGPGIGQSVLLDPGFINAPVIFEPPPELSNHEPVIWIVATGAAPNWGGCQIFMSVDDISYGQIGVLFTGNVQGELTATFASGSDPDIINTLSVDITETGPGAQIISVSQLIADDFISLLYVGGELVTFTEATLTSAFNYDLDTYFRRGVYDTTISSHPAGTTFATLLQTTFRFGYRENMIGQTVYFKFPSFNIFGAALQDISVLPSYPYTLLGTSVNVSDLECPVDIALAAGTASLDWGVLGSPQSSECDWGTLGSTVNLEIDLGTINITG